MKFENIQKFDIDELLLDQGNYRFVSAKDQAECIKKIYDSGPKNFSSIMTNIAEKDLDELLLVWNDEENGKYIVFDGNRRLSALKVLNDPSLAPNTSIKNKALDLKKNPNSKAKFSGILAQVSADKDSILNSVYDRHAAGGGISKINWNAFANARFRFDGDFDDTEEWKIVALLMELNKENPKTSDFIDSKKFSFEVFRRIMRSAIKENFFSERIFLESKKRLRKQYKKDRKRALNYIKIFLSDMEKGELTLSRESSDGSYANRENILRYLNKFKNRADGINNETSPQSSESEKSKKSEAKRRSSVSENTKILSIFDKNRDLNELLKLENLYNSLTTISLKQHPVLQWICASAFFQVLADTHIYVLEKKSDAGDFPGYLNKKTFSVWKLGKNSNRNKALIAIRDAGNTGKHGASSTPVDAGRIATDMPILNDMIICALNDIVNGLRRNNP